MSSYQDPPSDGEKKQIFFEAAEPLLIRYGFKKTTVDEICRDAGYSRGTFYDLFDDKTAMLFELIIARATEMFHRWHQKADASQSAMQRIRSLVEFIGHHGMQHPLFLEARKHHDLFAYHGQATERHRDNPILLHLQELVEEGVERGEFRSVQPERMSMLLFIVVDNLFFQTNELYHIPSGLEDRAFGEEAWQFIEHGLGVQR